MHLNEISWDKSLNWWDLFLINKVRQWEFEGWNIRDFWVN